MNEIYEKQQAAKSVEPVAIAKTELSPANGVQHRDG
jgi:hypothetical protein